MDAAMVESAPFLLPGRAPSADTFAQVPAEVKSCLVHPYQVPPDPPAAEPNALAGPPATVEKAAVNWRRNLAALWLAELTAILGFSFAFPFLPLFLHQELRIPNGPQLAFWSGISAGATGFALALTSPIWGRLADRYGRKPMLVRAMVGGGISVGLMGLAQSALQLTVLRGIQGASSGTVAAATALVATETPSAHLAWALGILNSAISLGNAAGPAAGALAANVFGLRAIFLGGGLLLLVATVPVLLVVHEGPRRVARIDAGRPMQVLRAARAGTIQALAVLMVAEALQQTSYGASQQLVVLRLLELMPSSQAQSLTGITFAAAGIATALAAVTYSRLLRRSSYRVVITAAAGLTALMLLGSALATTPALLITTFVLASFVTGATIPALGAMIGLEVPAVIQATVFGVSSSAISIGFGLGPLLGGFVASAAGVRAALGTSAAIALVTAVLLGALSREPRPIIGRSPQK
jgi:MFS transporter, DHA1 family, multidrug resistance protein